MSALDDYFQRNEKERQQESLVESRKSFWKDHNFWLTFLLVAATVGLDYYTFEVVKEERKNAELSVAALERSQRAWLVYGRIEGMESVPHVGNEWLIAEKLTNTGREPATKVSMKAKYATFDLLRTDEAMMLALQRQHGEDCLSIKSDDDDRAIYPSDGSGTSNSTLVVPAHLITDDFLEGRKVLFVMPCAAYVTGGTQHHSSHCFSVQLKPQRRIIDCRYGILAD